MAIAEDPSLIEGHYLFQSEEKNPVKAFELLTQLKVNDCDVCVIPIATLEKVAEDPKQSKKSWWNSFWDDGWSHLTFGTVSTAFGVGFLCLATGPVGWVSGVLAIGGGAVSVFSGGGQLISDDPETKKLFAQIGDVSLSLNNIPGLAAGTTTYVLTGDYGRTVDYANIAGLVSGGSGLARGGFKAIKMQRLYNLEVGLKSTKWSSRTRGINAMLMEVDPKGLEGSHLVPQRIVRTLVTKFPKHQRHIENIANGPLGINIISPLQHALVDPYRYRTLPLASKETLSAINPIRGMLLENYPQVAGALGIVPNMSPTVRPVFNSLAITSGRAIKTEATSSSSE